MIHSDEDTLDDDLDFDLGGGECGSRVSIRRAFRNGTILDKSLQVRFLYQIAWHLHGITLNSAPGQTGIPKHAT